MRIGGPDPTLTGLAGLAAVEELPATEGTGLKVVAWDFPTLVDPVAGEHRLAKAARYRCTGCPRVAAVAPDVETAAEGTRIGVVARGRARSAPARSWTRSWR